MTLLAIGLMIIAALGVWVFRTQRRIALLILSIIALYALQPSGTPTVLDSALPTATLLLIVGVWWLVGSEPTPVDRKLLLLFVGVASLAALINSLNSGQVLTVLPPIAVLAIGTVSVGAIVPRTDSAVRRQMGLIFVVLIILLLVILKLPALQTVVSGSLSRSIGQTIIPGWQWLGFSYIAFRLMHVLLDYRNQRLGAVNLTDFALYTIFFPAIPAGPIDRIEHFTRELDQPITLDADRIINGLTRIGIGLFKKFVLADTLAYLALSPQLVEQTRPGSFLITWIMVYAYAFRLFFDFSGYTDIAIGIGILAGIKLPENFTSPYTKRNISAFWNSWHITLSLWFRNYFFTPLSRALMGSSLRSQRLLIILLAQVSTMILIGLWHGIALNFVLWGAWHGLGLWFHRWLTDHTHAWDERVQAQPRLVSAIHVLSVLATFHFVAVGWIFFALPDLPLIGKALMGLVGH
ncbi:MAG: MBOAT family O-acyltransferase [Chloroflexota bacterium]